MLHLYISRVTGSISTLAVPSHPDGGPGPPLSQVGGDYIIHYFIFSPPLRGGKRHELRLSVGIEEDSEMTNLMLFAVVLSDGPATVIATHSFDKSFRRFIVALSFCSDRST